MSVNLANVDLTGVAVGFSQTISLGSVIPYWSNTAPGNTQNTPGALQWYNESGCGLQIALPGSSRQFTLPAGAWRTVPLQPNDASYTLSVVYVLPNAPASLLLATFYEPGEDVPHVGVLGNSPIGLSGQVSANVQQIINDGKSPPGSIIEATPSDQVASSWSLNNDASGFIQVLSANVLRKVLNIVRGNTGTTHATVTLGDAGDTQMVSVIGKLAGHGDLGKSPQLESDTVGTGMAVGYSAPYVVFVPSLVSSTALGFKFVTVDSAGTYHNALSISPTSTGIDMVANQAAVGLGVPVIVAQAINVAVTVTTSQVILSYTPSAIGLYRVSISISYGDTTATRKIAFLSWTDAKLNTGLQQKFTTNDSNSIVAIDGVSNGLDAGPGAYAPFPMTVYAATTGAITVNYQNPSGTVNDAVSAVIERLG